MRTKQRSFQFCRYTHNQVNSHVIRVTNRPAFRTVPFSPGHRLEQARANPAAASSPNGSALPTPDQTVPPLPPELWPVGRGAQRLGPSLTGQFAVVVRKCVDPWLNSTSELRPSVRGRSQQAGRRLLVESSRQAIRPCVPFPMDTEVRCCPRKNVSRDHYFARPLYPCAIVGIAMMRLRALGVPH